MASPAGRDLSAGRRVAGNHFYLLPNPVWASGTYPSVSQPITDVLVRNRGHSRFTRPDPLPVELLVHEFNPVLRPICPWLFRLKD